MGAGHTACEAISRSIRCARRRQRTGPSVRRRDRIGVRRRLSAESRVFSSRKSTGLPYREPLPRLMVRRPGAHEELVMSDASRRVTGAWGFINHVSRDR